MDLNVARALVAAAAWLLSQDAQANRYVIVDLGEAASPVGIDRASAIAGNTAVPHPRGEVYRGGAWHHLPPHSQAAAINRLGEVVGTDARRHQPVVWPHNAAPVEVTLPAGATAGTGFGINDGRAVVGYFDDVQGDPHCYLWTPDAGALDLGSPGQGAACVARAINDAGQVTGEATSQIVGPLHAFVWSQGSFTDLGVLRGTGSSNGLAINDAGEVVGTSYGVDGSRAFLWNGTLVDLDPAERNLVSVASGINNAGGIVGWIQKRYDDPTVAVRFAHARIIRLVDEVTNLGDWKLEAATAISDRGDIVGVGRHGQDGASHGFHLEPVRAAEVHP
jgi:probable HAF family extracellular repeat protein